MQRLDGDRRPLVVGPESVEACPSGRLALGGGAGPSARRRRRLGPGRRRRGRPARRPRSAGRPGRSRRSHAGASRRRRPGGPSRWSCASLALPSPDAAGHEPNRPVLAAPRVGEPLLAERGSRRDEEPRQARPRRGPRLGLARGRRAVRAPRPGLRRRVTAISRRMAIGTDRRPRARRRGGSHGEAPWRVHRINRFDQSSKRSEPIVAQGSGTARGGAGRRAARGSWPGRSGPGPWCGGGSRAGRSAGQPVAPDLRARRRAGSWRPGRRTPPRPGRSRGPRSPAPSCSSTRPQSRSATGAKTTSAAARS